ncbi:MAG: mandelate racemase/muconate lactonizing enzyme family protein [SAR202 cluster bacterium]|jgi:L-alanine-DL-glutamate epimerase-like enolase superfamily enzyme|nr:mandelate racemase/muconate lactonizing enzyme family protein [SAR202 cluster bacterium]
MKVTDVKVETYRWKRHKPIRNGRYVYPNSGLDVIKVETDEGITGIGLSGGVQEAEEIGRSILGHLKQYVIDQDPFDTERVWDDMWQPKLVGRRGITTRVISGIDIALWDIKGKVANRPVHKLLGGFADKVPVYIAGGYYEEGKGLEDLATEMETAVSMGAKAIKMKIGGAPINEDVERVRVVRDAVGPEVKLMVDANCAYRYYEAIEIARKMEKYDIFWFEEPVNPDDYKGHKLVSRATTIPIATGENEYTRYGFRDLIEERCAAIIQPDALIMGGVSEFMKVAALAQAHDLPVAPHGKQEVHIQLVAAVPNGLTLEYYSGSTDPMWDKMFEETLQLEDGFVRPPDRPGMGIELNEEALAPHRVG